MECEVEGKNKEIKKKKSKGTCVEEVTGKMRKKEKKLRVCVWRRKKEGKKRRKYG